MSAPRGSGRSGPARVLVTRPYDRDALRPLLVEERFDTRVLEEGIADDPQRLRREARDCHGLLTMLTEPVDARLLDACPELEVVSNMAVGYDNIDVEAASERGVLVCNTPDVLTETTAELTVALLFAVARRIVEADRFVRAGRWQRWQPDALLGIDLLGETLGVVGAGRIGAAVARRARALGMEIVYSGPSAKPDLESELGARRLELDDLLRTAGVVSLHAPLAAQTERLLDRRRLALLRSDAILLNTARGPLVDEGALAEALVEGRLFGAGLDVFEDEPRVHPDLLDLDNVVLVPHIGSATVATRRRMAEAAVENLVRALDGRPPLSAVNADVLG